MSGVRTRRYHALRLAAVTPPTCRMALVNGFEAHVITPAGRFALSSQRYAPDVLHPDGWTRIESFTHEPWPHWVFRLPDGTRVEQSRFAAHGAGCVVVRFRALTPARPLRLELRPLLSGRDYHGLQRENPAFRFAADGGGQRLRFRPYAGVPAVISLANAD